MKLVLAVIAVLWAAQAQAACRQALALGLDVSGSVDAREYRMQMDGLARALMHPEVQDALLVMLETPVALAVFEWSGPEDQRVLVPWTSVVGVDALQGISSTLLTTKRTPAEPSTALGAAMRVGARLLAQQPECWKLTLDISGDGKSNTGAHPRDVRATLPDRVTVNGLVIGQDTGNNGADARQLGIGELSSYYNAFVIHGPDAFVETALGFADYERAMVRKLKRELQSLVVSELDPR